MDQRQQPEPRLVFTKPIVTIDLLMRDRGNLRTSKMCRVMIIIVSAVEFQAAMLRERVRVTTIYVPAAMYSVYNPTSEEARLNTFTSWADAERTTVWRLLERPGLSVCRDLGKGVLLECLIGTNLNGVASPALGVAPLQALHYLGKRA